MGSGDAAVESQLNEFHVDKGQGREGEKMHCADIIRQCLVMLYPSDHTRS